MKELEAQAREKGSVPLNKLARYETEEIRRREALSTETPAVLALLPDRNLLSKKDQAQGVHGALCDGWALCRRAGYTEPVDGWQILVDPQQPYDVTVGKTVLVDRQDLIGTKIPAKIVDRWVAPDAAFRFTVLFEDGERRFKVPREEMMVIENRYFYWNCKTVETCWEPPEAVRKPLFKMFKGRKARKLAADKERKRLKELEEERRRRLARGETLEEVETALALKEHGEETAVTATTSSPQKDHPETALATPTAETALATPTAPAAAPPSDDDVDERKKFDRWSEEPARDDDASPAPPVSDGSAARSRAFAVGKISPPRFEFPWNFFAGSGRTFRTTRPVWTGLRCLARTGATSSPIRTRGSYDISEIGRSTSIAASSVDSGETRSSRNGKPPSGACS